VGQNFACSLHIKTFSPGISNFGVAMKRLSVPHESAPSFEWALLMESCGMASFATEPESEPDITPLPGHDIPVPDIHDPVPADIPAPPLTPPVMPTPTALRWQGHWHMPHWHMPHWLTGRGA
jgi:hypothetical protein